MNKTPLTPERVPAPTAAEDLVAQGQAAQGQAVNEAATLAHLQKLADLMDRRFTLPGSKIGVGLDSILGFLPVVGDAATAGPGLYLLVRAHRLGVRKRTLMRMGKNLLLDLGVGSIPLVGDIFDIAFRSNVKNVELIRRDLAARTRS